jgi:prepilin-type N-terminal cleavage/methylation domain-containing protein
MNLTPSHSHASHASASSHIVRSGAARRSAFTLIELLTVIAIIAILAAILIPTVGSIRENASMTKDLSRLREIGKGLAMYANDHKMRLPHQDDAIPGTDAGNGSNRWTFYEAVDRYFDPVEKFNPRSIYNNKRRELWYSQSVGYPPEKSGRPVGFAPNPYMFRGGGPWLGRMLNVPSPAQIVLMAETNNTAGSGPYDLKPDSPASFDPDEESFYRVTQPGNKGLYLFGDYHVEALEGDRSEGALATQGKLNIWRWW